MILSETSVVPVVVLEADVVGAVVPVVMPVVPLGPVVGPVVEGGGGGVKYTVMVTCVIEIWVN